MKEALRLAKLGYGKTSPNPMVGAVVVRNGKIVGKGYHRKKGKPHAEIIALKNAGKSAKGATLYVNLEPCCHYGATPPCTKAIIKAGIEEVHTAIIDPSPWVNGKGIKELKKAGIKIVVGECEISATRLNEVYLTYIKTGLPFVILKAAITLDGKIADAHKDSKWITSPEPRKFVHHLRAGVDAVLVGIGTVIADDPKLTVRLVKGKNPKRIVLDSNLSIPENANVLGNDCIIATLRKPNSQINAEIWHLPEDNGKVNILELLKRAASAGIQSIMVEGGSKIFTQFLTKRLVNKVYFFIAPKILGDGIPVVADIGIQNLPVALHLSSVKHRRIGEDILLQGYLKNPIIAHR